MNYKLRKHRIKYGKLKPKRGEIAFLNLCEKLDWWRNNLTKSEDWVIRFGSLFTGMWLTELTFSTPIPYAFMVEFSLTVICVGILIIVYINKRKP